MKKNIAVIDDSELFRTEVASLLSSNGYAASSHGSVREFKEYERAENVDMILLDVDLPGMSGTDFVEELAQQGKLKTVPLVMISGTTDEACIKRFKKLLESDTILAIDFFRKDRFNFDILFMKLHSMLRLRDMVTKYPMPSKVDA